MTGGRPGLWLLCVLISLHRLHTKGHGSLLSHTLFLTHPHS